MTQEVKFYSCYSNSQAYEVFNKLVDMGFSVTYKYNKSVLNGEWQIEAKREIESNKDTK